MVKPGITDSEEKPEDWPSDKSYEDMKFNKKNCEAYNWGAVARVTFIQQTCNKKEQLKNA